jgi:hypothetical protein
MADTRRAFPLLVAIAAGFCIATTAARADNPAAAVLDHFVCYRALPPHFQGPNNLAVVDQFFTEPHRIVLTLRDLLCNPVSKNDSTELHPEAHLFCYRVRYRIDDPLLLIPVRIENQFGKNQRMKILHEFKFCLPTGKIEMPKPLPEPPVPPIPANLDHFMCYDVVLVSGFTPRRVHLKDQFKFPINKRTMVIAPRFLCAPAEKWIDGEPKTRQLNPQAHLACYEIESQWGGPRIVSMHNQFEADGNTRVSRRDILCVPSTKTRLLPDPNRRRRARSQ